MPLYEYRCANCDEQFEVLKSLADTDEENCPKCDRPAQKQIGGFVVGSGAGSSTGASCTSGWSGG